MNMNFTAMSFRTNEWGQLVLDLETGESYVGIEPVRCFPLSDPEHTIALLDSDGHELANLPSLEVLAPAARTTLQQELRNREFVPVIQRIVAVSVANPPCEWTVETDRGPTRFQLESEDDLRRIGPAGAVIADSHGIRYRVHDINALDDFSQKTIRRLI